MQASSVTGIGAERQKRSANFGAGQSTERVQGHWALARAGKKVLRPGGLGLTRQMLSALRIGSADRVVEFAPGLGVTARLVLERHPAAYFGVERDAVAAERLERLYARGGVCVVPAPAEKSGLPDATATVVYSEALLSMQTAEQKGRILAEAHRLLVPGGRYAIHELVLLPDAILNETRREIQAEMSKNIHVGVQPLTRAEWFRLFEQQGFQVQWLREAPMRLLRPRRLIEDEGLAGALGFLFRIARHRALRHRIGEMRRLFQRYEAHLGAIALVAVRV